MAMPQKDRAEEGQESERRCARKERRKTQKTHGMETQARGEVLSLKAQDKRKHKCTLLEKESKKGQVRLEARGERSSRRSQKAQEERQHEIMEVRDSTAQGDKEA